MSKELLYIYKYRFGFGQLLNLIIGIGLIGCSLFMTFRFDLDNTLIVIICFLSLIGLTPLLLTFNYLAQSLRVCIRIDLENETFKVTQNERTNSYRVGDIMSMEICEQKTIGLYGFDFDFATYTFSNGNFCIVTNHMTNEYFIPAGIEPKIHKAIFPIIWKRMNA